MRYQENLFKRDSNGNIRHWQITVSPNKGTGHTIITFGQLHGQYVTKERFTTEGKNIGKANETSPLAQAISEARSKVVIQRKQGYKSFDDLGIKYVAEEPNPLTGDNILGHYVAQGLKYPSAEVVLDVVLPVYNTDIHGNIIPMKAQKFYVVRKRKAGDVVARNCKLPALGQPKINGVRAFCAWDENRNTAVLFSKAGHEYSVPHITQQFTHNHFVSEDGIDIIYDGELYIHNEFLSEIRSAVIKPNLKTSLLEYRIFDLAIEDLDQETRLDILYQHFPIRTPEPGLVLSVPTVDVMDEDHANKLCDLCISKGYEGLMVRQPKGIYKFGGRSKDLVKLKRRESAEFIILDVIPMENAPTLGMFVCRNDINHETFTVVPQGTHEQKAEYLTNRAEYIHKLLTVEFYERTAAPKELPFHTTGVAIRDYE